MPGHKLPYAGLPTRLEQMVENHVSALARLEQARVASERGMWALAALNLRAAVVKMPGQASGYARLAHVYLRLGRSDLAQDALQQAKQIDPSDPRVAELLALLK